MTRKPTSKSFGNTYLSVNTAIGDESPQTRAWSRFCLAQIILLCSLRPAHGPVGGPILRLWTQGSSPFEPIL